MESIKNVIEWIILIAALTGAVTTIIYFVRSIFMPFDKLKKLEDENAALSKVVKDKEKEIIERHDRDIRDIKEEQALTTFGVLACLKGLKEQGCNGTVTEAIDKIEKYLNEKAHDR